MKNWELLVRNNFDKRLIANELKMDSNSIEFQEIIDDIILNKIKDLNKGKKVEEQILGFNKEEVLKASHLTSKTIENHYELLKKILKAKTMEEIVDLCSKSYFKFGKNNIYSFCLGYCNLYKCDDKLDKVINNMLGKLELYKKYKRDIRNNNLEDKKYNNENLKKIEELLQIYIDSSYTNINDFVNDFNLKNKNKPNYKYVTMYNISINLKEIMKNNPELYQMYCDKNNNVLQVKYNNINKVVSGIIYKIKNGIEENGEFRKFDLLDYYLETNLEPNIVINVLNKCSIEDAKIFRQFIKKYYKNMIPLYKSIINSIMIEKMVVDIEFDEFGNVIPNTGRVVTREEKEKVIKFLNDNNIPLYEITYSFALKRYLTGNLDLDTKVKVK